MTHKISSILLSNILYIEPDHLFRTIITKHIPLDFFFSIYTRRLGWSRINLVFFPSLIFFPSEKITRYTTDTLGVRS